MKKSLLLGAFACALIGLTSCGSDEPTKDLEIVIDGVATSLENAGIYMHEGGNAGNGTHKYRSYYIIDGDTEIYFELAVLNEASYTPGNYPNKADWNGFESNTISYIQLSGNLGSLSSYENGDFDPIVAKGGLDVDDKLTVSFQGMLNDNNAGKEVSFYYSGTVEQYVE